MFLFSVPDSATFFTVRKQELQTTKGFGAAANDEGGTF